MICCFVCLTYSKYIEIKLVLLLLCGIVALAVGALSLGAEIIEPKLLQYLDRLQEIADLAQT